MKNKGLGILPFIIIIIFFNAFTNTSTDFFAVGIVIFFVVFGYILKLSKTGQIKKENGDFTFQTRRPHQTQCTYCNQLIDAHAEVCPICGNRQNETIFCEYCGHVNKGNNLQCENCNALIK